jgi:hypothetical protein
MGTSFELSAFSFPRWLEHFPGLFQPASYFGAYPFALIRQGLGDILRREPFEWSGQGRKKFLPAVFCGRRCSFILPGHMIETGMRYRDRLAGRRA